LRDENSPYSFASILGKIIARKPGLKKEKLLEIVEKKRAEAEGLLNREGAAFLVAAELGVPLTDSHLTTKLEIKDLMPNLGNVTVSGRVLAVYPLQTFSRKDGSQGRLRRVLIGDRTGMLDVHLWDDKAEELVRLHIDRNSPINVIHGYTRQSLNGRTELHMGDRGAVEFLPSEMADRQLPSFKSFFVKIGSMKDGHDANLEGKITQVFPSRQFTRADGEGRVMKLTVEDETGSINIVAWNKKVAEIEAAKPGDQLELVAGSVKEDNVGKLEVHANHRTHLKIHPSSSTIEGQQPSTVQKTTNNMYHTGDAGNNRGGHPNVHP